MNSKIFKNTVAMIKDVVLFINKNVTLYLILKINLIEQII